MGTKTNPGKFDCYQNAGPDEPMFVLLGRDRHAAGLVRLWALLRSKDGESEAKVAEALACANAMDEHVRKLAATEPDRKGGDPVRNDAVFHDLYTKVTEDMLEHPEGFDCPCSCNLCLSYD